MGYHWKAEYYGVTSDIKKEHLIYEKVIHYRQW